MTRLTEPADPPAAVAGLDPASTAPASNPPAAGADPITKSGVVEQRAYAPLGGDSTSLAGAEADVDRQLINVTPLHTGKISSTGMPRHDDCLNVDACAGTWRQVCHTCRKAAAARIAVEPGGVAIEHQGSVA